MAADPDPSPYKNPYRRAKGSFFYLDIFLLSTSQRGVEMWQPTKSLISLAKSLVLLTALLSSSALGANHYYGLTASNALGNRDSYTCRTQSDVSPPVRWL